MRPKYYRILSRAIEEGINIGYRRAHRHTETPTDDHIKERIESAILDEICEVMSFDDEFNM